jgi:hypothetical protein
MNAEQAAAFSALSHQEQMEFLALLAHELTIIARDSYQTEGEGLTHPSRIRRLNEIQHRVAMHLYKLLRNDLRRYSDDLIVRLTLESSDDAELQRGLQAAFARTMSCFSVAV